ncbi:MAG TPA: prepilin-type N-terminal cleavage/methylation domain-containing protein [Bryobacteraceae bacterium]|nr:prepilin-type N-terminal cleavage/methylation domain-containing protein [Bryobacteraceae bacterium]
MRSQSHSERGVTLIEVLIAVSLLSLLSAGMLTAMRVGLDAMNKSNERLMANRRVAGVQRIIVQQVAGFMPVMAQCMGTDPEAPRAKMPFFQGEQRVMRFVSTFSLDEAWRGLPRILEYLVIPGENGEGVRLVVNEIVYTGPRGAGLLCLGVAPDPLTGVPGPRFRPAEAGPHSFVLADKLAFCRFAYLEAALPGAPPMTPDRWRPDWVAPAWPLGVRIEMAPLEAEAARLQPVTVTAPVPIRRSPQIPYGDY